MAYRGRLFLSLWLCALLAASGGAFAKQPSKKRPIRPTSAPVVATAIRASAAPVAATAANAQVAQSPNLIMLDTASGMAAGGAPRLALQLMDRDQPDFAVDPVGWMSWERARIYIYQASRNWGAVIGRAQKLTAAASPDFRVWEDMQAADAWLHLGDVGKARALLLPLIWDGAAPPADADLASIRQLLIRSDLAEQKLDDAQTGVIRYRQDYPKDAGHWPVLEARLFLRTDQAQAALDVLQDIQGPEADMLALLAALRSGELTPGAVLTQAVSTASDSKLPEDERAHAWIIAAEAAAGIKNTVARVSALQNALGVQAGMIDVDDVFSLTPDALWDAYLAYGGDLGNQLQLVMGDDQAWWAAAASRVDSDPVGACALFSMLAFNAQNPQQAALAHWQFATLIQRQKGGDNLLRHLYLDSSRFNDLSVIPDGVRYLLVDDVLELPDIPLASKLMQGLDEAPTGTDPAAWQLQRARVFVLGGNPDAGIVAIQQLLAGTAVVNPDDVLQVLFDLQTLGRDKDAIPFFERLLVGTLQPEQRRQILYWTADSYRALGDYSKAAELYLRSAMLPDPFSMDQWAQTARYQAAQMLGKAGFIEDARNLYHSLLNATHDAARQAVLEHDLQQLMLLPAKTAAPGDKAP